MGKIRKERIRRRVVSAIRKLYVASYNIYGFYWLYKIIWVLEFNWENLLLWFFAMGGLYFFILKNKEELGIADYHRGV